MEATYKPTKVFTIKFFRKLEINQKLEMKSYKDYTGEIEEEKIHNTHRIHIAKWQILHYE